MSQPHYSTKKSNVLRAEIFQVEAVSQLLVLKISPEHVFDLLCQYFQWPQLQLSHFSKLIWTNKVRAEYWLELAAATVGLDCYETCKCLRAYSDWLYGDFTVFEAELHTSCPQDKYIYFLNKSYLLFHYHPDSCLPDNSLNLNLKQTSQSVISIIEAIICFCVFGKQITWFFLKLSSVEKCNIIMQRCSYLFYSSLWLAVFGFQLETRTQNDQVTSKLKSEVQNWKGEILHLW